MLILACRLFLHTPNNALLGTNSFEKLVSNIASRSVKQFLNPVDSVYVRSYTRTIAVSAILRGSFMLRSMLRIIRACTYGNTLRSCAQLYAFTVLNIAIYAMMQPIAHLTIKCNGVVLRLQNIGENTNSVEVQICNFKKLLSVTASSASTLHSHFHFCESYTKKVASSADMQII